MAEHTSHRIAGLDGMRAIAILIVFVGHYAVITFPAHAPLLERAFPGMLGVTLFFVLSGFLISFLLIKEYEKHGSINLKDFYLRRLVRLSPALYAYVAITCVAYLIADGSVRVADFIAALTYTSNYYQISAHTSMYYMPVWSLAIEEHFYLMFPVMLIIALRRGLPALAGMTIGLIVVVFVWRLLVAGVGRVDWHHIYWRTDTRIDSILFGVLLACIMGTGRHATIQRLVASGRGLLLGLLLMAVSVVYRNELFRMSARYTIQGLALALIMGYVVYNRERLGDWMRWLLDAPPMLFISRISYSLYLWHLTIVMFVEHVHGAVSIRIGSLCLLGSLLLATASYYLIEAPLVEWRRRLGSHSTQ